MDATALRWQGRCVLQGIGVEARLWPGGDGTSLAGKAAAAREASDVVEVRL